MAVRSAAGQRADFRVASTPRPDAARQSEVFCRPRLAAPGRWRAGWRRPIYRRRRVFRPWPVTDQE
eukprot:10561918-Lingulodinium_polyedra.AAC.1